MKLTKLRKLISVQRFCDEDRAVLKLVINDNFTLKKRQLTVDHAAEIVRLIRSDAQPGLMEQLLAEYGLSTNEGVALMCLAEAYLRTPDELSLDALISDKIGPGDWGSHIETAGSFLVNASTWALMLTGRMFKAPDSDSQPMSDVMLQALGRLGEPLIQKAIKQAMRILGKQFVLGRNISEALKQSAKNTNHSYRYSFDMLGEAARTTADSEKYYQSYADAISAITIQATSSEVHANPGISVKLSALHPRYEYVQHQQVMDQLVNRVLSLAKQACVANIGFTIDAEEADRLELSLDVIEAVLSDSYLTGWDGFGVVVQAYSKQAPVVIKWLESLAIKLDRRIAVRLVKGAYWDYEIKNAQVLGLQNYPVFTRKVLTDVSYLYCAQQLLDASQTIYPQFATHNAHSACAIVEMVKPGQVFEFQRLHGMGAVLHRLLIESSQNPCRIYAPVGVHKDLLAYLVRRLLENGANSSFVHKLLDERAPLEELIADPIKAMERLTEIINPRIPLPKNIYAERRLNSSGINLNLPLQAKRLDQSLILFKSMQWNAQPMIPGQILSTKSRLIYSPANPQLKVGEVREADDQNVELAFKNAAATFDDWSNRDVNERADLLEKIADLYQENQSELIALATLEAGKTRLDGIMEIREAIDFCRYYAAQARHQLVVNKKLKGIGPFVCISPWNFPLAIFTGQITAALVSGNPVLAKPAEQTTLIAARAVELMHRAGVPEDVLQLVPGDGATVGKALTSSCFVKGVCFTGSTATAMLIDRVLAAYTDPNYRLIAETGGLNTMIVDSTALLEQAVRDIVASAFYSAGQRCSALRILCVQQEIELPLMEMLAGAAMELVIGDPWHEATDVGPVIDEEARKTITDHCDRMTEKGRLLFKVPLPEKCLRGFFVSPMAFKLNTLDELKQEIFGPVLHVIGYQADRLDELVNQINSSGFGLTMGIHSRVDTRVKRICQLAKVGNIYVNRNQIGAVVGVQPFGGQGLSGTGPKAGGPHYLQAFCTTPDLPSPVPDDPELEKDRILKLMDSLISRLKNTETPSFCQAVWSECASRLAVLNIIISHLPEPHAAIARVACMIDTNHLHAPVTLQGPTGEKNELSVHGRGIILCLGGGVEHDKSLVVQVFRTLMTGNLVTINTAAVDRCSPDNKTAVVPLLIEAFKRVELFNQLLSVTNVETEMQLLNPQISMVMYDGDPSKKIKYRQILASRDGIRVALVSSTAATEMLIVEQLVSTDTTASGGNASLLAFGDG